MCVKSEIIEINVIESDESIIDNRSNDPVKWSIFSEEDIQFWLTQEPSDF